MHLGAVIRDIAIVWILTAIGGFVVGVAAGIMHLDDPQRITNLIAVSNIALGTLAFTIAGCLAPEERWNHLTLVALGSWVLGYVNVIYFGVTVGQWIASAIFILIMMGMGGAISLVLKSDD